MPPLPRLDRSFTEGEECHHHLGIATSNTLDENEHWEINDAALTLRELESAFERLARSRALRRLVFYRPCGGLSITSKLNVGRLVEALSGTFSVRSLSLANTGLRDLDLESLAKTLLDKRFRIESLNLSSNRISDRGVETIAKALHVNTTLEVLDLEANAFGDDGASHLARALDVNNTLRELDISSNHLHSDQGRGYFAVGEALKTNRACLEVRLDPDVAESRYWRGVLRAQGRYIARRLVAYALMKGVTPPKVFLGTALSEGERIDFSHDSILGRVAEFVVGRVRSEKEWHVVDENDTRSGSNNVGEAIPVVGADMRQRRERPVGWRFGGPWTTTTTMT